MQVSQMIFDIDLCDSSIKMMMVMVMVMKLICKVLNSSHPDLEGREQSEGGNAEVGKGSVPFGAVSELPALSKEA